MSQVAIRGAQPQRFGISPVRAVAPAGEFQRVEVSGWSKNTDAFACQTVLFVEAILEFRPQEVQFEAAAASGIEGFEFTKGDQCVMFVASSGARTDDVVFHALRPSRVSRRDSEIDLAALLPEAALRACAATAGLNFDQLLADASRHVATNEIQRRTHRFSREELGDLVDGEFDD